MIGNNRLRGKVALITGAASGMGRAETRLFLAEGATVIAADIAADDYVDLASPSLHVQRLDVACAQSWDTTAGAILDHWGRLDILVNNAGINHYATVAETEPADFDRVVAVNQRGCYLGMRAAVPLMRAAGGGSIVNISSTAGLVGMRNMFAYVSTKWAIRGMSKAAALELARENIRVNSVHPGLIDTPMTRRGTDEEQRQRAASTTFGRAADAIELARLVLFLASDEASFCSGGEYACDGAATAGVSSARVWR